MDSASEIAIKLRRADDLQKRLKVDLEAFLAENYRVETAFSEETRESRLKAFGESRLPLMFSVLVGEIIHHFRSSLDYCITQLSTNPSRLDKLAFPICDTKTKFDLAVKQGKLNGVSEEHLKIIERNQPFQAPDPKTVLLYWINELNRIDKHRLLLIVQSRVLVTGTKIDIKANSDSSIIGLIHPPTRAVIPNSDGCDLGGVVQGEPYDPCLEISTDVMFGVVIDGAGILSGYDLYDALAQMGNASLTVVTRLFPGFEY